MNNSKDLSDMALRLRAINANLGILASVTANGTKAVVFDNEMVADALYAVVHSLDTVIIDLEQADTDALNVMVAPKTMKKLYSSAEEEHKRGNEVADLKAYASELLADAVGWKYAELFKPSEEPELTDEELDALGIPTVCIVKQ